MHLFMVRYAHFVCLKVLFIMSIYVGLVYVVIYLDIWSRMYCSTKIGVVCMFIAALATILLYSLSYSVGSTTVVSIATCMTVHFVQCSQSTVFSLGSYCRPCGYKCMLFESVILLN